MARETPALSIRPLEPADLPAAVDLQLQTYPPFLVEDEAIFRNRIDMAAGYCLAAWQDGALVGYLLAHGWQRQSPPPLGALLADAAGNDVLFIHDLAVSPTQRGQRIGQQLIARAFEQAVRDGLRRAELIAVEGAAEYWRGLGFAEEAGSAALAEKLRPYGAQARWMTRAIP